MKKNRRLVPLALIILIVMFALSACGQETVNESIVKASVEKAFNEKYDEPFTVETMDISGNTVSGTAKTDSVSGVSFTASVDGTNLKDDYTGILYDTEIEKAISAILVKYKKINTNGVNIEYPLVETTYKDVKDYTAAGSVSLAGSIVSNDTSNDAVQEIMDLVDELQDTGISFSLDIYARNNRIRVSYIRDGKKVNTNSIWKHLQ